MIKYTKDHEWIRSTEEDGVYEVGISPFAIKELGDIVYIELEFDREDDVEQDGVFGTIEAVKTVSDLFMPVTGIIVDINDRLFDEPETLTIDSALSEYFIKIEVSDETQLDDLISEEDYLKEYPI